MTDNNVPHHGVVYSGIIYCYAPLYGKHYYTTSCGVDLKKNGNNHHTTYTSHIAVVTCEDCLASKQYQEDSYRYHISYNGDAELFIERVVRARQDAEWDGTTDDPSK